MIFFSAVTSEGLCIQNTLKKALGSSVPQPGKTTIHIRAVSLGHGHLEKTADHHHKGIEPRANKTVAALASPSFLCGCSLSLSQG